MTERPAQDVYKRQTTTASNSKSVADKYNLTITSDLSLKQEDENDTVKAMQLRL